VGRHKLFHAVVVMGISAAGCASHDGQTETQADAGTAAPIPPVVTLPDAGPAPSGEPWPSSCEYRYQYVCDSYAPLSGCRCDASRPRNDDDCGGAARTHCAAAFCGPDETCGGLAQTYVDCRCVPDAPATPDDCAGPGQFVCADPASVRDCRCDSSRPKTPEDCAHPEYFHCASTEPGGMYADCICETGDLAEDCQGDLHLSCQSTTPLFGCNCVPTGIK
jgi:hypothetical protein